MALTLGSLFDGSGGFPLGGILAGIEPKWASEVEPFPIRVTTKRLPGMQHLGNIKEMDGGEIEPVDVIAGGSPCFPAGTLVLTDSGYEPIENLRIGMRVLTHEGRWRRISAIGSKLSRTMKLLGNHHGLECTSNHPIYSGTETFTDVDGEQVRHISQDKTWTHAQDMLGRYWAVPTKMEALPISHLPKIQMDIGFFYFLGRWLVDGCVNGVPRIGRHHKGRKPNRLCLTGPLDRESELKVIVEHINEKFTVEYFRKRVKVCFTQPVLTEWVISEFGRHSGVKKLPAWVFGMPEEWRMALLEGVLDSDGWHSDKTSWEIISASKKLVHGLSLLAEGLGYATMIYKSQKYVLTVAEDAARLDDGLHSWYQVNSIEKLSQIKEVYNISVAEDESYIADGVVVHNCQDLSLAGKRAGLIEGERSNLFFEFMRVVKEMREKTNGRYPRYIIWENVFGAFSSNKGHDFRAVLDSIIQIKEPEAPSVPMPENGKWPYADVLMGDGWSIAYRTFDAQYWGVPQRRRRIYLVADFGGQCAGKILFESEGLPGYSASGCWKGQGTAGGAQACIGKPGNGIFDVRFTSDGTVNARGHCYETQISRALDTGGQNPDSNHGGVLFLEVQGVDAYNQDVTGEKAAALGQNCGMSTGRNGVLCLNDQGGKRMDITNGLTQTLRAQSSHPPLVFENNISDARYSGPLKVSQTVEARWGTGGNNQGLVVETPKTMKIRSGRDGGGKGPLIQEDKSATLGCSNDQTVFVPDSSVAAVEGNGARPSHQGSGFREDGTMYTLNTIETHAVAYGIDRAAFNQGKNAKFGFAVEDDIEPTIVSSGPNAVAAPTYSSSKASYFTDASENVAAALVATDYKEPPLVNDSAYGFYPQMKAEGMAIKKEVSAALVNGTNPGYQNGVVEPCYIVRRLTPTECARLQGFPDWWCSNLGTENPTDEDLVYWKKVFDTYNAILGKKPKSEKQVLSWLKDPYSDAAEYKMWGNGVALPCVVFVMAGIVQAQQNEIDELLS